MVALIIRTESDKAKMPSFFFFLKENYHHRSHGFKCTAPFLLSKTMHPSMLI